MKNRILPSELRASMEEACSAVRAHKDMIDRIAADFRRSSRQSRESIRASYVILTRLREADRKPASPAQEERLVRGSAARSGRR